MKFKITLSLIVFFLLIIFYSCEYGPSEGTFLSLKIHHDRGNPLIYNFNVSWNDIDQGYIYAIITPGPSPSPFQEWHVGSIDSKSGEKTTTYIFPDNNPSPTSYVIRAEVRSSTTSNYTVLKTTPSYSLDISFKKFNIIQLAMTGDNLWPDYPPDNYYYGEKKKR